MTTAATAKTFYYNPLTVQKSYQQYQQQIEQLVKSAWQITFTALWNTLQFSAAETNSAKQYITGFLMQASNHKANYNQLVQRVLMARQYVNSHPGTYIPVPSVWFDAENKNGFAGTARWFDALQQTRASLPQHKQALKLLAKPFTKPYKTTMQQIFIIGAVILYNKMPTASSIFI